MSGRTTKAQRDAWRHNAMCQIQAAVAADRVSAGRTLRLLDDIAALRRELGDVAKARLVELEPNVFIAPDHVQTAAVEKVRSSSDPTKGGWRLVLSADRADIRLAVDTSEEARAMLARVFDLVELAEPTKETESLDTEAVEPEE